MALQGPVDWKGRPVNPKRHGGVKATMFIYFLIVMTNMGNIPTLLNILSFLHGTMHMGVADASTTATNFYGALCVFSFLGAFISDSYIKRFYSILIFAPVEILGYMLLACQAHFPSLHPPPCDIMNNPDKCALATSQNLSLLHLGLYVISIGEGGLRVRAAALGGDQFDGDDPDELRGKISFFNWFTFCISLGGFVGLVFVVWVQNNEGWDHGFALSALMVLVGATAILGGLPFYRHQVPTGSPLTRILQVFVAAFRKRNLSLAEDNLVEVHDVNDGWGKNVEFLDKTRSFKFLDKAALYDGDDRPWSRCTVMQVEEAKIILRMLPIFLSSVLGYVPIPLLLTFTVQQGATMDTRLGALRIPPANLFIVPIVFQLVILVAYDSAIVPWLRRLTGYSGGISHLQRVGAGFATNIIALAVAATVEGHRRRRMASSPAMSVLCLSPQFVLLGVVDVTSFVGLLEFFYGEASPGMKSIGGAVFFCILGAASWIGSLFIRVVNRVTARSNGGHGWLDGANLDAGRLDLFYWLLAVFGVVSFVLYVVCAWRYTYRRDPRMASAMEEERVSPVLTKQNQASA